MNEKLKCQLCGEPMPEGEEMFFYHGYSGPCPKPPLARVKEEPKLFTEADLRRAREEGKERIDRLECQLAGCGVAATGWAKGEQQAKPEDWGWSASYQSVVELRQSWESQQEKIEQLKRGFIDMTNIQGAGARKLQRMECGHLQADLVADPKCRYCDEGYSRIQSSVTEAFVHVGTPVGRVVCTGNPTFIFKESPTDAHHKAMPASYCRICAELQKVREEAAIAAAGAMRERVAAITDGHLDATEALGIHRLSAYIRNSPLVTSPEGEKWLREHDAGVRAGTFRYVANHFAHRADLRKNLNTVKETAYTQVANACEQWAEAQSAGTPE